MSEEGFFRASPALRITVAGNGMCYSTMRLALSTSQIAGLERQQLKIKYSSNG